MKRLILPYVILSFIFFQTTFLNAQPKPGDYFREYRWTTPNNKGNSPFLRVGGKMGYMLMPEKYPNIQFREDQIPFECSINHEKVIKAEATAEKVLCHEGTKKLSIALNNNDPVIFPESKNIPEPQSLYAHHFYPSVEIPLSDFNSGDDNYFSMQVDSIQDWNWPQNLVYGVVFRFYYPAPEPQFGVKVEAKQLSEDIVSIKLDTEDNEEIESVDFIAKYDGPDMDGDGEYIDWHYHYFRGEVKNHVGSDNQPPFETEWDISWLPDQDKPIQVSARINYKSGFTYFVSPSEIEIYRESYSVELCKPIEQPQKWLTRKGEHQEKVIINSDPQMITEARMQFTTWSPGYFNGIYINDFLVFLREGDKYASMQHTISVDYLYALEKGENIIKTGKTPRHHGEMVHGVELMWPGIMLLVKSKIK